MQDAIHPKLSQTRYTRTYYIFELKMYILVIEK